MMQQCNNKNHLDVKMLKVLSVGIFRLISLIEQILTRLRLKAVNVTNYQKYYS